MNGLMKGQSPYGASEGDSGHNTPDPNAGKVPTESEIVSASEKNVAGTAQETGFNPGKK